MKKGGRRNDYMRNKQILKKDHLDLFIYLMD